MESANIETEIETKAREKAFSVNKDSNLVKFIDITLNMKC